MQAELAGGVAAKIVRPADISEMRVWFTDPVVPQKGDSKAAAEKPEAKAAAPARL
ncbi:MAG: hypothetical protein NTX87_19335 [Planctomycetota bacterium]|nr:hypothetical protein [Planctomycetota bacterium]